MAKRSRQLALALRAAPRWGGNRVGAGRKPTGTAAVRHGVRERYPRPLPTHVTLRVRRDVPSLRTVAVVRDVERTFARGCVRPGFRLVHYVLMGNHAHLVVEACDRAALGRGMKAIGARLARAVNRIAKRSGPVFADRYHSRVLRTPREVHRTLRYVLLNARKHAGKAGTPMRATVARLDPASSARWFDGWKPEAMRGTERAAVPFLEKAAVARARTWLLRKGWRLHGLLDPRDVPG